MTRTRTVRSPVLVGRTAELAAVRQHVDAAAAGSGRALLVTGEAGIGKTRLLDEAARRAGGHSMVVLRGRAVQGGGTYRAVAEALLATLDRPELAGSAALRPYRAALARLLPSWAGAAPAMPDVDPVVLLGEGLVRLLTAVGTPGCALLLEDLHWADGDTIALVEHLAGAVAGSPILLAVSARAEGGTAAERLASTPRMTPLRLGRLDRSGVAALAAACRGGEPVPATLVESLLARSEGVPFLVEELLGGDGLPPTLAALVTARLDALAPDDRAVLRAAAVLGGEPDWGLLAPATGAGEQAVLGALRAAVDHGLLVADSERLRWPHALTREAVLATLLPPERVVLARRAADVLAGRSGSDDAPRAAELYLEAAEPDRAAGLLLDLGRRAAARGALHSAEQLLARAAQTGARAAAVTVERVGVLAMVGRGEEAIGLGDAALGALHGDEHAELCLRLARAAVVGGRWAAAEGYVERAGRPDDPRSLVLRADAAFGAGRAGEAAELADAAVLAAEQAGAHASLCEALGIAARSRLSTGRTDAATAHRRAAQVAAEHGLTPWRVAAVAGIAMFDAMTTDGSTSSLTPGDAIASLRHARELALDAGMLAQLVSIDIVLADHTMTVTGPRAAAQVVRQAAEIVAPLRWPGQQAMVDLLLAGFLGANGDAAAMEELIGATVRRAPGNAEHAAYAAMARVPVALLEHDLGHAAAHADDATGFLLGHAATPSLPVFGLWALLRTAVGDRDAEARARIRAHPAMVRPANRAALAYADAIVAGRSGEPAAAAARFSAGDAALAHQPWWRRLLRLVALEAAVADGWGEPLPALRADLAVHEAATGGAAERLARTCRDLLRRAGQRAGNRRDHARVPPALRAVGVTGREVDVLELVAQGLTNAQVAERLFLSTRTVDSHVASLLAKTGAVRRTELAGWAGDRDR